MRITSPPKYQRQNQKSFISYKSDNNKLNYQNYQSRQTILPLECMNQTSRISNQTIKQKLMDDFKNKQLEYVELIKDLHKENQLLKSQLGKITHKQAQLQNIVKQNYRKPNIYVVETPKKNQLNHSMTSLPSQINMIPFSPRNNLNQSMNVPVTMTTVLHKNISPFSRKPIILAQTSPIKPSIISVVRPKKKVISPIKQVLNCSIKSPVKIIYQSPQKSLNNNQKYIKKTRTIINNHKSPIVTQKIPINNSPFKSIKGLNISFIQNKQNTTRIQQSIKNQSVCQKQVTINKEQFFDLKKRQLNYGYSFKKPSQSSFKPSKNVLKMNDLINNKKQQKIQQVSQRSSNLQENNAHKSQIRYNESPKVQSVNPYNLNQLNQNKATFDEFLNIDETQRIVMNSSNNPRLRNKQYQQRSYVHQQQEQSSLKVIQNVSVKSIIVQHPTIVMMLHQTQQQKKYQLSKTYQEDSKRSERNENNLSHDQIQQQQQQIHKIQSKSNIIIIDNQLNNQLINSPTNQQTKQHIQQSRSQRHRLNRSFEYDVFYTQKIDKLNVQQSKKQKISNRIYGGGQNKANSNNISQSMKEHQLLSASGFSNSTLRSQKYRRISNQAYM